MSILVDNFPFTCPEYNSAGFPFVRSIDGISNLLIPELFQLQAQDSTKSSPQAYKVDRNRFKKGINKPECRGGSDRVGNNCASTRKVHTLKYAPSIDLIENDNMFTIFASIPESSYPDFHVAFDENTSSLDIKGKVKISHSEAGGKVLKVHLSEIHSGAFERKIIIPGTAKINKPDINTSYENGILVVELPKIQPSETTSEETPDTCSKTSSLSTPEPSATPSRISSPTKDVGDKQPLTKKPFVRRIPVTWDDSEDW